MPKIYLSPPYHKWNPCSISGCDETTHNNLYMDELEVYLKACGIEYKRGPRRVPKSNEDGTAIMNAVIKESNAWKPDIHYVSHTNAYDGIVTGCRPMIYPKNNPKGEKLAEILTKYRKQIYSGPITIKRTDQWAELRETTAVAYYEEHVFHDNKGDAQWFHDNMRKIAEITCKGFCEYFNIPFIDPYETNLTTVIKEYKIITTVNRYSSASDAKAQINNKGSYSPDTYYIYNKYPDGLNGMYNITTDKTGESAGSWINPVENVIKESTPIVVAPEVQKEQSKEEVKKAVYDLEFPTKTKIVDKLKYFSSKEIEQASLYILNNNANFDINIAKAFYDLSPKYGISPTMAISQSILETGWFKYEGSAVKPEHHNYCGLGVTSNGVEGCKFDTIENGVRAQLQHLYAYGCTEDLPQEETEIVDPRFKYVERGVAPYWEQLAGRWCVSGYEGDDPETSIKEGTTYGQKILKIANGLLSVELPQENNDDYTEQKTEEEKTENNDNSVESGFAKIFVDILVKLFKKLIKIIFKK